MFTITQGTPTEQQIVLASGIAAFCVFAPLLIGSAALFGWFVRTTGGPAPVRQREWIAGGDRVPDCDHTTAAHGAIPAGARAPQPAAFFEAGHAHHGDRNLAG